VLVAAVLILVTAMLACIGGQGGTLPVGEAAPDFGIRQKNGALTLGDLRGNVVMVSFWSST
jgi:hypothetical protein